MASYMKHTTIIDSSSSKFIFEIQVHLIDEEKISLIVPIVGLISIIAPV